MLMFPLLQLNCREILQLFKYLPYIQVKATSNLFCIWGSHSAYEEYDLLDGEAV
jgi:hypothetical protein